MIHMKILSNLLRTVVPRSVYGNADIVVMSIEHDSRKCGADSLFIAIKGTTTDGHNFIHTAIQNGAKAIICEYLPDILHDNVVYVTVDNSRQYAADIAHEFYDYPANRLKIIGVTGTNGKTSVTFILRNLLEASGYKCGIIGTTGNYIGNHYLPTSYTTPEAPELVQLLHQMVSEGMDYVCMEVSSHALIMHRVRGIRFTAALFTNLTHDHLDFHGTMDEYAKAKKILFDMLPDDALAIVNADSNYAHFMVKDTKATKFFVGTQTHCDTVIHSVYTALSGSDFSLTFNHSHCLSRDVPFSVPLIGFFNIENIALCLALAVELGISYHSIQEIAPILRGAPGRMESLSLPSGAIAIIDYAHTPDALEKVLLSCRHILQTLTDNSGKIITVFGCGGDRDKAKRPLMGHIASIHSDYVTITNDNPRTESPNAIAHDILKGFSRMLPTEIILDRKQALAFALSLASFGDIVLIAGKGHESTQIIGTNHYTFNDKEIVADYILNKSLSSPQPSQFEGNI